MTVKETNELFKEFKIVSGNNAFPIHLLHKSHKTFPQKMLKITLHKKIVKIQMKLTKKNYNAKLSSNCHLTLLVI